MCEVSYDHMQGDRFRHAAQFVRWRPDKQPRDCRYDQLEVTPAYELERVFGARDGRERFGEDDPAARESEDSAVRAEARGVAAPLRRGARASGAPPAARERSHSSRKPRQGS